MDLSKRLANLDRLSRKNKLSTGDENSRPNIENSIAKPLLEKSLCELGLKAHDSSKWPAWVRNYSEELIDPISYIPTLTGFFTRADEASPDLEKILFLDTETTGLSGGTGTIAFLVGVGWISGQQFISRQYFLPDFAHENHMLKQLHSLAADFEVVMTFNGASFDLPLLRTRALMNRLPNPCGDLVSWDLLVPGRRLWGRCFEDCRQQTLEKGLLDIRRGAGDIDGALIPQTWFDFIGDGNGALMSRVLHHNQKDLLGMVGIFSHVLDMAHLLHDNSRNADHWVLSWALSRVAEKAHLPVHAAAWIEKSMLCASMELEQGYSQAPFVKDAIRLLKRQKAWQRVNQVISRALDNGLDEPWLHREAAILFEHRLRHLKLALSHAEHCEEPLRVQRLEKKIATNEGYHESIDTQ